MRNIISGNNNSGISLDGSGGNIIQGNLIGTDAPGTAALGNTIYGIYIGGNSTNNLVGGTEPDRGNIISGGHIRGILISGTTASNNRVLGNYIGTDISGTMPLGNEDGIRIADAPNNIIGGTETGEGNVISGNDVFGIVISNSGATGNQVLGNKIGTDLSGTVALGNGTTGIFVGSSASGNIIGGTTTGAGNLISSNGLRGIQVSSGASNNQILGNFIGTDVTGTVDLGNGADGIMIHNAPDNIIGGTASGARNLISGNDDNRVSVLVDGATGNQIIGNYIGTDITGASVLGNLKGVQIWSALNNTVSGNIIHYNTSYGVIIDNSVAENNTLTQNSITDNGEGHLDRGILLRNSANIDISAPAITDVTANQVVGTSTAPDSSTIEIFQDTGDQGNIYISVRRLYRAMPSHSPALHPPVQPAGI
ncbi:MAG: right-handed parallel beta-helix repeat-containing protein [Desulfosarcina sp.]|nr:right-handed parallel beta-helix repeat-containing protein [Desulfosarcina sp.]